ncbi:hypothetical protein BDF20DRAFT_855146 [Mycotypha africana]|uniref:uncharacterized protein n=1 Tax=Mycotypha africana TaxID=64632 RepID=UPI002301B463|nr:uncharacterized protein BDF20DRAFT_855146 [Mycotypha africana]KAI8988326.1 hypothetical protein BDF20DRAFT_855146 [Mycotypha africana]
MSLRSSILSLTRKADFTALSFTKSTRQFSMSAIAKQASPNRNGSSSSSSSSNKVSFDSGLNENLLNLPESLSQKIEGAAPKETAYSLQAYIGRSVAHSNANVAYRQLNGILTRNRIRQDVRNNRHYVKPNEARRLQKVESSRKLFNAMVKKKIGIIMQMKQRGM